MPRTLESTLVGQRHDLGGAALVEADALPRGAARTDPDGDGDLVAAALVGVRGDHDHLGIAGHAPDVAQAGLLRRALA
jgi:hypothetical protein